MPRIIPPGSLLDAELPAPRTQGLRVGQVLRASVVEGTPPGRGGGPAVLALGRLTVGVRAQLPLPAGSTLTVQVTRLLPTLSLRLLDPLKPPAPGTRPEAEAARGLLPRQGGWGQAVETVASALRRRLLPEEAAGRARALLRSLPTRASISTPEGLRAALRDSGLFLEARLLAQPQAAPEGDLKAALLRLRALLPAHGGQAPAGGPAAPTPPRPGAAPTAQARAAALPLPAELSEALGSLRRLVEGALARIGLHQLGSREAEGDGGRAWMLELPVLNEDGHYDVLQLRIRADREGRGRGQAAGRWSVELALDLPGLGPLHARIGLQGRRVAASLWLERPESAAAVEAALPELERALRARALEVGALRCRQGRPEPPPAPPDSGALVETRA